MYTTGFSRSSPWLINGPNHFAEAGLEGSEHYRIEPSWESAN